MTAATSLGSCSRWGAGQGRSCWRGRMEDPVGDRVRSPREGRAGACRPRYCRGSLGSRDSAWGPPPPPAPRAGSPGTWRTCVRSRLRAAGEGTRFWKTRQQAAQAPAFAFISSPPPVCAGVEGGSCGGPCTGPGLGGGTLHTAPPPRGQPKRPSWCCCAAGTQRERGLRWTKLFQGLAAS